MNRDTSSSCSLPIDITLLHNHFVHSLNGSYDLDVLLLPFQYVSCMPFHREVLLVARSSQCRELLVCCGVDNSSNVCPVDCRLQMSESLLHKDNRVLTRAHRTWLPG